MRRFLVLLLCLALLLSAAFAESYEVFSVGEDTLSDPDPDPNAEPLRFGVRDRDGNEVIPPVYEAIVEDSGDESCFLVQKDGLWGYLGMDGEWLIEPKYEMANAFVDDYAVVGRTGYDESRADGFSSDGSYALFGVIDREGREVLPMAYENIIYYPDDGCFMLDEKLCALGADGPVEVAQLQNYVSEFDYAPFESAGVAKLDGEPTLTARSDKGHRHPRLDGARDIFPFYAAVVQAVYPETTRYGDVSDKDPVVTATDTETAIERLADGSADIIFVPAEAAAALGEGYECTPFARDALVFVVNAANPADGMSTDELRGVFSGKTTAWPDGRKIVSYQCLEGSQGQAMLTSLMDGANLKRPPRETDMGFFADDATNLAYRNLENAIGSSLRFYCADAENKGMKLLKVDGVAPTDEAVRSGEYPYVQEYVIVTRANEENGNVAQLKDWILSEQGRKLVEAAGYVAVK